MGTHHYKHGFKPNYTTWDMHGEKKEIRKKLRVEEMVKLGLLIGIHKLIWSSKDVDHLLRKTIVDKTCQILKLIFFQTIGCM